MKKLLYISLGFQPNDFYDSFCKYFDCKLYTGVQDAIAFNPDYIHLHAGSLSLEDATLLKSKTNAIWTQFTGDCSTEPLEPVTRLKDICDITLLTIAEGLGHLYQDCKRVTWMPEAVLPMKQPKELTDGKIVFVGNYYDHLPDGNQRREICETLHKTYPNKFECYGSMPFSKGEIPYTQVPDLYNDSFIVIAHDNNSSVKKYFSQRYLAAMGTSCCVGKRVEGMLDDYLSYPNLAAMLFTVKYLYDNPYVRNDIAKRSFKVINEGFTYDKWVERYIKIIND